MIDRHASWIRVPDNSGRLLHRGSTCFLPGWDYFNLLLGRVSAVAEHPREVAAALEAELLLRRPDLAGLQCVGFGFDYSRHCMWMTVLHGSLPEIPDGCLATEIVVEPLTIEKYAD